MPRTARATVAGHYYHAINRGNQQARVFNEEADYHQFVDTMQQAQRREPLSILAACLMPNHFHFLVRPAHDKQLSGWMHWLMTAHVRRHHKLNGTNGRIWQGRYKVFPVQGDVHLITVMRYIERNALRANLVERAEQWRWGSLNWRSASTMPLELTRPPVQLPADWVAYVNAPQSPAEIRELRQCVNRQRPFGAEGWVQETARELGLEGSLRSPGRPQRTTIAGEK
jgi:putative transposase